MLWEVRIRRVQNKGVGEGGKPWGMGVLKDQVRNQPFIQSFNKFKVPSMVSY